MDSFLREPSRLAAEQQRIVNEMIDVSMRHYPVFIKSAATCGEVLKEVAVDAQVTERLQREEETLRERLQRLVQRGQEWKKGRQQLLVLRSSQELIRDLFELPATLENCLRNELYHEAVLLYEKAESLLAAAPDLPVIEGIAAEVEDTMKKYLPQLIARLSTALSPAQCIKITRFLSRLKLMSNRELRQVFLSRRQVYLQSLLRDTQRRPFTYLNRICNVLSVNLPAVVTEFHTSFEQGEAKLAPHDADEDVPACDVLGAWMANTVDANLKLIETNLALISSGGELKQLLEQAMQCGKQLAAKGVDVRPILYDMYSKRIYELWAQGVDTAYANFAMSLKNHTWCRQSGYVAGRETKFERTAGTTVAPPQVLRQYLPLGYLTNAVLNAMNELRRCSLSSLTPKLLGKLQGCLEQCVADTVEAYHSQALDEGELSGFLAFVKVMHDDLLPYLARSVDIMLSTSRGLPSRDIGAPLMAIYKRHVKAPPRAAATEEKNPDAGGAAAPGDAPPAAEPAAPVAAPLPAATDTDRPSP
eukprot:TRINITY_DN6348_c0_g1_i1.p1 TRINITY_DN6348_c0_g1~~TRINITY_DN6348_c0_g1_i1.p1  ORF type:complete len:531 (+),score=219.29 TRINITY_DN6348_c0_g1_i1:87-1679(+)